MRIRKAIGAAVAAGMVGLSGTVWAGVPTPWQINLQQPATESAQRIQDFHTLLLWIITLITLFVLGLLVYVCVKFNARRNPVPNKVTHNTMIEMAWTVVPVIILVLIAVPSFKLLYFADTIPEADVTVKAIGHQWYWSYEYPDHDNFTFDAAMVQTADLKPEQRHLRLLETNNAVVVPVNAAVRVQVTASDVLHAWAVPAFGVKVDAVPGRLNEIWFRAFREGTFYGQCSELCGTNHGFMPIKVEVVSKEQFESWVAGKKRAAQGRTAPADALAHATDTAR